MVMKEDYLLHFGSGKQTVIADTCMDIHWNLSLSLVQIGLMKITGLLISEL